MPGKSVIIIGCGIAGPVLAMLLKHKGFDPVIYERQPNVNQGGIALGVSPQTFKVLNILGLATQLEPLGQVMGRMRSVSQLSGETLGEFNPAFMRQKLGWPMFMISRPVYSQFLYDAARERGVEVNFNKRLTGVSQEGERVNARFEDGSEVEGDLLVGCDGLHSAVREALFGGEDVKYTGMVQIGGLAPIPEYITSEGLTGYQALGDGVHWMSAKIDASQVVWVTTMHQPTEAREDWRRINIDDARETLKALPVAGWENSPQEVLSKATFVTKYGLYERPILERWHKGRVVLLGDAAHPTTPHLGQGANQAMEDCYHLVRLLCKAEPLSSASMDTAFTEYETLRVPIVTRAVAGAKAEGAKRVVSGKEACEKRDADMKSGGGVSPERMRLQLELLGGPFTGESEI